MQINNFFLSQYYQKQYQLVYSNKSIKIPFFKLLNVFFVKLYTTTTTQPKLIFNKKVKFNFFFSKKPKKIIFFFKLKRNTNNTYRFLNS